jgi:hypothetical protein
MVSIEQLALLADGAEEDLKYAGIFGPNFGIKEDMPNINLSEAFSPDNQNVYLRNGEIERVRMRFPEFIEAEFSTGTITATNGSKTITASGGAGTWGTSLTHKPYWIGRKIVITDGGNDYEYTIAAVADNGATATLSANYEGTGGAGLAYTIGTPGDKVRTPDENAIIHYHRLVITSSGANVEYELVFTKAHVYLWSTAWSAFVLKFTCSSACVLWSTASMKNQVIATNNIDKVQAWGSTTADLFANLTGNANGILVATGVYLTKAKCLIIFENRVVLGDVTVGGTRYAERVDYSSLDDETDFNVDGTGDAGNLTIRHTVQGGEDSIVGFGRYRDWLIIGKTNSMHYYWAVEDEDVFAGDVLLPSVGLLAMNTIVNDKEGRLYWLASDFTIREVTQGIISKFRDNTIKNINPLIAYLSKATFIESTGQLLFSIPYGNDSTANNKVLWYDIEYGRWGNLDIATPAFGAWTRQAAYTIDTIPFDSIDEIGWDTIDSVENVVGFVLDLCSDYSGYSYCLNSAETDAGAAYTGYFTISTDLLERVLSKRYGDTLRGYKRLEFIQLWLRAQPQGTITVNIKPDNIAGFTEIAEVSLVKGGQEIFEYTVGMNDCDVRGRIFELKISGVNRFSFLGVIFGFMPDGGR